jgi:hypothetical protein
MTLGFARKSGFLRRVQHPKCIAAGGSLAVARMAVAAPSWQLDRAEAKDNFPPDSAVRPGRPECRVCAVSGRSPEHAIGP